MTTVIKTKNSTTTTTAPSSLAQGELAVNITDKKLWVGNAAGTPVQILGSGATNIAGGSNTQVQYNSSGALAGSSNLTFDGTALTLGGNPTLSAGTANGVLYLNGSKVATSGSSFVFDGTNVGIGTSSPSNKLEVVGSYIAIKRAGAVAGYSITDTTAAKSAFYQYTQGSSLFIGAEGSTPIVFANTDALTERMRIDSSGNVGIGTSSPAALLDVFGSGKSVLVGGTSSGSIPTQITASSLYLSTAWDAINKRNVKISVDGDNNMLFGNSGVITYASLPSSGSYTTTMTLSASGNLGLGVTPSAWSSSFKSLDIGTRSAGFAGSDDATYVSTNSYNNGGWKFKGTSTGGYRSALYQQFDGSHQWFYGNTGTAGNAITFTQAMTLDASGNLGIGSTSVTGIGSNVTTLKIAGRNTSNAGGIQLYSSDDTTVKARTWAETGGWYFDLQTAQPMIFNTSGTERMRIDSSGNLLLATTTVTSSGWLQTTSSSSKYAWVDRASTTTGSPAGFANTSGTIVGQITHNGTNTTYSTSSDYRLKENIAPMTGALSTVAQLKPCTYTWKFDGSSSQGFIAHELQEVIPEAVVGEKDAVNEDGSIKPQGIDTSFLVATLTAAIQELNAKVVALEAQLAK